MDVDDINSIAEIYLDAKKEQLNESNAFLRVVHLLEGIYLQDGISTFSQSMLEATSVCCTKAKDAEAFGEGFFRIIAGGGDSFGDTEAILFERLVERFPCSVKLAEMLGATYGVLVSETRDKTYIEKLDNLSKNNPALENVALQQLYALVDSHFDNDITLEKYIKAIDKTKEIYIQHQKTNFAITYASGLKYLLYKQEEEEALKTIGLLEELFVIWGDELIGSYLDALWKLIRKQDEKGALETVGKIERIYQSSSYRKNILAMNLAYSLADYSLCAYGAEKDKVIDKIANLAEYWAPAKKMAYELSKGIYAYAHKPAKAK